MSIPRLNSCSFNIVSRSKSLNHKILLCLDNLIVSSLIPFLIMMIECGVKELFQKKNEFYVMIFKEKDYVLCVSIAWYFQN
jgi:hypothetical protein